MREESQTGDGSGGNLSDTNAQLRIPAETWLKYVSSENVFCFGDSPTTGVDWLRFPVYDVGGVNILVLFARFENASQGQ